MAFDQFKQRTLVNITGGVDFSTKGSIDAPIAEFVSFINLHSNYCTTSSCSGRIVLFYNSNDSKGVYWTLVNHGFVPFEAVIANISSSFNFDRQDLLQHLRVEPFIMHICCRDIESAQFLLHQCLDCGFRESGITIGAKRVMLAIRTTAFLMELPIARNGQLLFDESYLQIIMKEANRKLRLNFDRIHRLQCMLLTAFQWPTLSLTSSSILNDNNDQYASLVRRFGAGMGVFNHGSSVIITGGQGLGLRGGDNNHRNANQKSSRKITPFMFNYHNHSIDLISVEAMSQSLSGVHGQVAIITLLDYEIIIVSGGRYSPSVALSVLSGVYYRRKGVSGLKFVPLAVSLLSASEEEATSLPGARWGHTFIPLLNRGANEVQCVLTGGRDLKHVYDDCYLCTLSLMSTGTAETEDIHVLSVQWTKVNITLPPRFFAASVVISHPLACELYSDRSRGLLLLHGGLGSLDDGGCPRPLSDSIAIDLSRAVVDVYRVTITASEAAEGAVLLARFGHNIASLTAGQVLIMAGGVGPDYNDTGIVTLKKCVDYLTGRLTLSLLSAVDCSSSGGDGSDGGVCLSCRSHGQLIVDSSKGVVYMITGGGPSLAFGDHLCSPVTLVITMGPPTALTATTTNTATTASSKIDKKNSHTIAVTTTNVSSVVVRSRVSALLTSSDHTKALKTILEDMNLLDKQIKIFSLTISKSLRDSDEEEAEDKSSIARYLTGSDSSNVSRRLNALPLTQLLLTEQEEQIIASFTAAASTGSLLVYCPVLTVPSTAGNGKGATGAVAPQPQRAEDRLKLFIDQQLITHSLPPLCPEALAQLPKRLEVMDDVLLLPSQAFTHPEYQPLISSTAGFYEQILAAINGTSSKGLKRIARRQEIGPDDVLRRSHAVFLYPADPNLDPQHGWVTIAQHGVKYSWEVSKVMFSKGNTTERRRMGLLPANNEAIVDLYTGIGYLSLPIVKIANAASLIACEWNPDSITALTRNIELNQLQGKVRIVHGDNRLTVPALLSELGDEHGVNGIADRVLLGLLPTSKPGWPLAVMLLKKSTGGWLHVHDNVGEADIMTWAEDCRAWFEKEFQAKDKAFAVSIGHIEKVKSYAPRVIHCVLDLHCTPS